MIPTQGASFVARQGPLETEKGLWISGDRLGQKRPMKIRKFQNYYSRIVIQIQTRAPGDRERFQNTPMAKTTNENLNFPEVLFLNYDSDSEMALAKTTNENQNLPPK